MSQDYGKIALSKHDLKHVYNELYNSIIDRLNLHLPTEENDPMKNQVATILNSFLLDVFDDARHSMIIDGVENVNVPINEVLALRERQEVVEPFDIEINKQLKEILVEFENEIVENTSQKRELPKQAAAAYDQFIDRIDQQVSKCLEEIDEEVAKVESETLVEVDDLPFEDMKQKQVENLKVLSKLTESIGHTTSQLNRDQESMDFLNHVYTKQK